ncbi:MAG: hypothetical protein KatS3mg035_1780 [Bacteroidia bacterium]|nr:MAG: hypothetical protein KatS3mg035_1780 [Bacteroidia bacterium]
MDIRELAFLYPEIYIVEADINPSYEQENIPVEKFLSFRIKPNSQLTVFLNPEEYGDKNLTEFLKRILVNGLKVAPESVSFAIVKNPFPSFLLKKNPNSIAILFGDFLIDREHIPTNMEVCEVFLLSEMLNDESKKRMAWNKMKPILDKLHLKNN